MAGTSRTYLTLKALIAIIFCLIGLQYLSLLQVNEKRRQPGPSRTLFYFEKDKTNGHCGLLECISDLLEPTKSIDINTEQPTLNHTIANNGTKPLCPMIPPGIY